MDIARQVIKEPDVDNPDQYARRIVTLAAIYSGMFAVSGVGFAILIWKGRHFVTLAQRSNVETLTLAFFLIFFAYLAFVSLPGARGAARILRFRLKARTGDRLEVERLKTRALGPPGLSRPPAAALNLVLEREDQRHRPFEIPIRDEAGSMGRLRIDGARLEHLEAHKDSSNNMFAYFVEQVMQVVELRSARPDIDIVEWKGLDDEQTEKYLGLVKFACRLEQHLGAEELWTRVTLTGGDCQELERRMGRICGALREEGMLPDWEYAGEHKLPIIPEPLGIISLSRSEKRVDPLASMGATFLVVIIVLVLMIFFVVLPPWVPGS